jgi:outer membrane lipoprotein-sorting protein
MIRRLIPVVWLATTLAIPGFRAAASASPPSVREVVASMVAAPALVDYEATKVLTAVHQDRAETVTVLESYKRLGRLRLEFLSPESVSGRLVIDDGVSVWQYEPSQHLVIHGPSFVHPAEGSESVEEFLRSALIAVLGTEEVIGRQTVVLAMETRDAGPSRRYWVDRETGVILRTEERDVTGEIVFTSFFTRISFGLNLPSALFRFTPPSGARAIDLYESGDPVSTPDALRQASGVWVPPTLPYGYRFRAGAVVHHAALTSTSASYTDGVRTLTVFVTASAQMAFPQIGVPMKMANGDARLLDVGYFRVLIWQEGGTTYAMAATLSPSRLLLVASALTQKP